MLILEIFMLTFADLLKRRKQRCPTEAALALTAIMAANQDPTQLVAFVTEVATITEDVRDRCLNSATASPVGSRSLEMTTTHAYK